MDRIEPATAARLLRAKAHELEARCLNTPGEDWTELDFLRADVGLLAGLLADLTERVNAPPLSDAAWSFDLDLERLGAEIAEQGARWRADPSHRREEARIVEILRRHALRAPRETRPDQAE